MKDVESLFNVVETNGKFRGYLLAISQQTLLDGISEAFTALRDVDKGTSIHRLSTSACLVVSFLHQYIVRYLCKRLMQLMTPEALISNRKKIPSSYIENYLVHQNHFGLKELLDDCHSLSQT